jgi:monoamine oxidase
MSQFKKSTRIPLMRTLRKTFELFLESEKKGAPPLEELISETVEKQEQMRRRDFLTTSAKGGLLLGVGVLAASCKKATGIDSALIRIGFPGLNGSVKTQPSIAIIGAGIAGLNCAWQLKKQGIDTTVYEGAANAGGRILTKSNYIGSGLTTELGGEFIDTGHTHMRNLVTEFGLELADTFEKSEASLARDSFYIDGRFYTEEEVMHAFAPYSKKIASDIQSIPDNFSFQDYTPSVLHFDQMSIKDYFDSISMPASLFLRKGLEGAYNTEYGLEVEEQTAINFLFLFSINPGNSGYDIFGESDERYKVIGGNQQIPNAVYDKISSQVKLGYALDKVGKNSSNKYVLHFTNGEEVLADLLVITIPFTVLKNVDLSELNLPGWKTNAIQNLGYGTNAKLLLGFNSRVWRQYQHSGYIFTNGTPANPSTYIQTGWDNSQMQPGTNGGFTVYGGGIQGLALNDSMAPIFVSQLETMWPGCAAAYTGVAKLVHWPSNPWVKASYSCWKVGQVTTISGAEGLAVDNLFFAGEHTSAWNQGFMEGGAETGAAVARTIGKMVLTNKK